MLFLQYSLTFENCDLHDLIKSGKYRKYVIKNYIIIQLRKKEEIIIEVYTIGKVIYYNYMLGEGVFQYIFAYLCTIFGKIKFQNATGV